MNVELVTDQSRLVELHADWDALAARSSWPNVFYEPWFIMPALELAGDRVVHAFVWSETRPSELIGYLPLKSQPSANWLRPRQFENWMHDYCFSGEPLIAAGLEEYFWSKLLSRLNTETRLGSSIRFKTLRGEGPSFEALQNVLRSQNYWHAFYRQIERAVLLHEGTSEDYFKTHLSRKRRKEFGRLRRRLSEQGEVSVTSVREDEDMARWIKSFLELEKRGWKGAQGTAMASQQSSKKFFEAITAHAAQTGRLHMIRLDFEGKLIAMMVSFLSPDKGNFNFKIAYDEAFSEYSPGVLLEISYTEKMLDDRETSVPWSDSCAAENHSMINRIWKHRLAFTSVKIAPKRPVAKLLSIYDHKVSQLLSANKE